MASVKDVFQALDRWAPFETQLGFDNSGHLVGRADREVKSILVALDVTMDVVEEAVGRGCDLIVAHHPVIFEPVKALTDKDPTGRVLLTLAENKISAICAHTNLDAAQGGVNDRLAQVLELRDTVLLEEGGVDREGRVYGIGKVGTPHQEGLSAGEYAAFVKEKLGAASVRYVDTGKRVKRVAVGGGSCGSMMADALRLGCDTFVTADVKYNVFLDAKELGLNLMDAGHYATENVVCPPVVEFLRREFPGVTVTLSSDHDEVYREA